MNTLFPALLKPIQKPAFTLSGEAGEPKPLSVEAEIVCINCKSTQERWTADDFTSCMDCGEVQGRSIDSGAEYRFFGSEDRGMVDPCRVGAPTDTRFPTSTLGTMILPHATGGNSTTRVAMARVRRFHSWNLLPYRERSLLQVFEQIAITATNNGFDQRTMDYAKDLYVKLVEHCDRRGMSRTSVVASCLYSALKYVNQPRKPKVVADMFHLSVKQFTKSLKYFQEILCMANQRGLISAAAAPAAQPSTRASNYISNPLSHLPISRRAYDAIKTVAIEIADKVEDLELCPENMPPSLAAGVLALILHSAKVLDISNDAIAKVCEVSEGTLVKCLKKLELAVKAKQIEIPVFKNLE
jgi:transcription initiation factor TFIIIB Brf1 subunit/transcription initiation factor TFIIB